MPRASITIAIPADVWIGSISRRFPDTRFRVQSARSAGGVGVALVELRSQELETVLDAVQNSGPVVDFEIFQQRDSLALVQIEATNPFLLFPVEAAAVPLQVPFEIRDGTVSWQLITTSDRLSALADQLDAFGVTYTVDRVQPDIDFEEILTQKQAWVLEEALQRGYYDSPRTCTLTELADELGIAASTCSDTLHRAEEHVIKQFDQETAIARPLLSA